MAQSYAFPAANENRGVVAASAYVDGRRVADISVVEAGEWVRRPRHIVWIGRGPRVARVELGAGGAAGGPGLGQALQQEAEVRTPAPCPLAALTDATGQ